MEDYQESVLNDKIGEIVEEASKLKSKADLAIVFSRHLKDHPKLVDGMLRDLKGTRQAHTDTVAAADDGKKAERALAKKAKHKQEVETEANELVVKRDASRLEAQKTYSDAENYYFKDIRGQILGSSNSIVISDYHVQPVSEVAPSWSNVDDCVQSLERAVHQFRAFEQSGLNEYYKMGQWLQASRDLFMRDGATQRAWLEWIAKKTTWAYKESWTIGMIDLSVFVKNHPRILAVKGVSSSLLMRYAKYRIELLDHPPTLEHEPKIPAYTIICGLFDDFFGR